MGTGQHSDSQGNDPVNPVVKRTDPKMRQSCTAGQDGHNELRRGRGDRHRKIQHVSQGRNDQAATANPEKARNEAEHEKYHDAQHAIIRIFEDHTVCDLFHTFVALSSRCMVTFPPDRCVRLRLENHEERKADQEDGEYALEQLPGHGGGGHDTEHCPGQGSGGKDEAGFEIDSFHPGIGGCSGEGVEQNHRQGNRRQPMRILMGIEQKQQRHQHEATARADEGSVCADDESQHDQAEILDYIMNDHFRNLPRDKGMVAIVRSDESKRLPGRYILCRLFDFIIHGEYCGEITLRLSYPIERITI